MDSLEQYAAGVNELAVLALRAEAPAHEYFEQALMRQDPLALELLRIRELFLSDSDRNRVLGLLPVGFFRDLKGAQRITAFVIAVEISARRSLQDLQRRFEPYNKRQPLFQKHAELWSHVRGDLIRDARVFSVREDGVLTVGGGTARLEPFLKTDLFAWTLATFLDAAIAVRLDPYFAPEHLPLPRLEEAILLPANPKWWQRLELRKGTKDGAQYALEAPESPRDDLEAFWDYKVRHVRRLEVHAVRRQDAYLSMMIEELVDTRAEDDMVLGRLIHWDTAAPVGTPVVDAETEHLDLAVNVYPGECGAKRLSENLANGKVIDAEMRTHLLRVDTVPVTAALAFAEGFFISRRLVSEWFNDQFRTDV